MFHVPCLQGRVSLVAGGGVRTGKPEHQKSIVLVTTKWRLLK